MIRITVESPWYKIAYTDPETGAIIETMRSPMIAAVAMEHSGRWTDVTHQPCQCIPLPPATAVIVEGLVADDVADKIAADGRYTVYTCEVVK